MSEPLNMIEIKARLLRIADHAVGAADYCSTGQDSAKLLGVADDLFDLVALIEDEVGPLPRLPVIPERPKEGLRKAARLAQALAAQEAEREKREQHRAEMQAAWVKHNQYTAQLKTEQIEAAPAEPPKPVPWQAQEPGIYP